MITITSTEQAPNGNPAQGTVTATPLDRMVNGTQTVEPEPVSGTYNASGQLQDASGIKPFAVAANDDPGTEPATAYRFVIQIDGAPVREGLAVVSHTVPGGTVDLSTLLEGQ